MLLFGDSRGNSSLVYSLACNPKNMSEALSLRVAVVNAGSNDPDELQQFLLVNTTLGPATSSVRVSCFRRLRSPE